MSSQVLQSEQTHVLPGRKRLDPEKVKEKVLALINAGITSPSDIARSIGWTGKNARITASRYIAKLEQEGRLKRSETGRVQLPEGTEAKADYVQLQKNAFAQIPAVAAWVRDMLTRKEGRPLKSWKQNLGKLYFVCEKLKIRPEQLYTPIHNPQTGVLMTRRQTAEYWLQEFAIKHPVQSNGYVLSVRDFTSTVGDVSWPRGRGGVASGKKRNYGKYAHVKLAPGQFERGIEICEQQGDLLLRDFFEFGVETGSRKQSLLATKVSDFEFHSDHAIVRVHESKTEGHGIADWEKGIYTPRTFEHIRARVEKCKAEGRELIFVEDNVWKSENEFSAKLKALYGAIGITDPYPFAHPFHALRHFSAHYWLELTNYDYTVVKGQIGHKTTEILEDVYGKMPADIRLAKIRAAVQGIRGRPS